MLNSKQKIIREVYKLADETNESGLENYLRTLELENIKFVQTIMYLGRDAQYSGTTENEIYESVYNSLSWTNDPEVEINQICEKIGVLREYIKNGLNILKISL